MIVGRPETVELAGRQRMVLPGSARYDTPPEPGTIVGPTYTKEFLVVLGTNDEGRTLFSYAQDDDLKACARIDPRSIVEHAAAQKRRLTG